MWFNWFFFVLFFCFNLYSVHTARILDLSLEIMLSPPKWGMKYLYNSKGFSFIPEQGIIFLVFRSQIHQCFPDRLAGCKSWDLQCKLHVNDWILNIQWKVFGWIEMVFHKQIYSDELTFFFLQTIKGRTSCYSTKKNAVRVVL